MAVVAVCPKDRLDWLTLTDQTTKTSTTTRPANPPDFGGTVILTGPVGDPRPEGALDLLDRRHSYSLTAGIVAADDNSSNDVAGPVTFALGEALGTSALRKGSVLARSDSADETGGATSVMTKDSFVEAAKRHC